VTDLTTCLVWEKKTGSIFGISLCPGGATCADPHNVNNLYTSSTGAPWNFDGTAATVFLAQLNSTAFAGHTDWRLPTMAGTTSIPTGQNPELESILLAPYYCGTSPCIDPVFGPTAASASRISRYQSSSPVRSDPASAWNVGFADGAVGFDSKTTPFFVRAVRGGP
jgi:hypothetical protein